MPFKFSRCLCLQHPQRDKVVEFYRQVLGLELAKQEFNNIELKADPFRLFFDQGPIMGPIMEFYVPDLEQAKQELVKSCCQVLRWEGKGGCCYVKDPFGFVFNLWEDPESFKK